MSWDPARQTVTFPQGHPLLGWTQCAVLGCERRVAQRALPACQDSRADERGGVPCRFFAIPGPLRGAWAWRRAPSAVRAARGSARGVPMLRA